MGWKKLIFGEKMPDRDDPKYRERYEKEVDTGRKTARLLGIDKAAACVLRFAIRFPKSFLTLVFGIVIFCLGYNIYRIATVANMPMERKTATERQETILKKRSVDIRDTLTVKQSKSDKDDNRQD